MDFSLNLKQILFCTASLLQCFIIQLCTSKAGKLRILENSIKSKTQLVLGKRGNVPVPHLVGSCFSAGVERTVQEAELGWTQLSQGLASWRSWS